MAERRSEKEIITEAYSDDAATSWRAPVQGYPAGIPWSLHLEAYEAYCKRWQTQPALIDLKGRGCRGGFATEELDVFVPGWRERVSYIGRLEAKISTILQATGCESEEDLIDMANVGRSLMNSIEVHTGEASLLEGWLAAEDPAEIVGDLYNRLEESLACHRQAMDEAKAATAIIGQIEAIFPNWRAYRDLVDCINSALPLIAPRGFRWIDKAITVTGGDYKYSGQLLCSFPKSPWSEVVRYIVRDRNNRLFIHNAQQCGLEADQ